MRTAAIPRRSGEDSARDEPQEEERGDETGEKGRFRAVGGHLDREGPFEPAPLSIGGAYVEPVLTPDGKHVAPGKRSGHVGEVHVDETGSLDQRKVGGDERAGWRRREPDGEVYRTARPFPGSVNVDGDGGRVLHGTQQGRVG